MDDDDQIGMSADADEFAAEGHEEEEEEEEEGTEDGPGDADADADGETGKLQIQAVPSLDSLFGLREIGREALCWQLSSAKPGNGVEQIRDQSTDTYWQSDGVAQPHWIRVHFARRVAISHVCLYLDYIVDESYTPHQLSVQAGCTTQDLIPAIQPPDVVVELKEPVGWCLIPLSSPPDPLDDDDDAMDVDTPGTGRNMVRTHLLQISLDAMHQNGRDTHIRQVQLYGPRTSGMTSALGFRSAMLDEGGRCSSKRTGIDEEFSTVAMSQYSTIR